MPSLKNLRILIKNMRRIVAGFVSVTSYTNIKLKNFPFEEEEMAIKNDRQEILSDRNLAIQKIQKNDNK